VKTPSGRACADVDVRGLGDDHLTDHSIKGVWVRLGGGAAIPARGYWFLSRAAGDVLAAVVHRIRSRRHGDEGGKLVRRRPDVERELLAEVPWPEAVERERPPMPEVASPRDAPRRTPGGRSSAGPRRAVGGGQVLPKSMGLWEKPKPEGWPARG
jgi:hypothetical protein